MFHMRETLQDPSAIELLCSKCLSLPLGLLCTSTGVNQRECWQLALWCWLPSSASGSADNRTSLLATEHQHSKLNIHSFIHPFVHGFLHSFIYSLSQSSRHWRPVAQCIPSKLNIVKACLTKFLSGCKSAYDLSKWDTEVPIAWHRRMCHSMAWQLAAVLADD